MSDDEKTIRQGGLSDELRPYVDRHEAEEIDRLGEHLLAERPRPRPAFRAELRARLSAKAPAREQWRPKRLGVLVASYLGSGFALLAVAALGLTGAGPRASGLTRDVVGRQTGIKRSPANRAGRRTASTR